MRSLALVGSAIWLWAGLAVSPAVFAQEKEVSKPTSQPAATADSRLEKLEKRVDQLEDTVKAKDAKIANLQRQLKNQTTPPAIGQPPPAASQSSEKGEIEKTTDDILKDIDSRTAAPVTLRTPASFNPDLAVVTDYKANGSTLNANPARNRFDVGELELDLRAAVDPRADAVAILPLARDVDDSLFFRKSNVTADSGRVDTSIDIEEAYLFLHDFGVPNLTAKLGRFHVRFGRENILHSHDWPTSDNNFVNQSFLGSEALVDNGLSLSYVVPPRLIGNQYVEFIGEFLSGESNGPVINNDAFMHTPGFNGHVLWNHDIAPDWNLEVGGSFLYGKHNNDYRQNVYLYGSDVTLIHTDPSGKFNNQLVQFESIYGDVGSARGQTQHSFGAYILAQQQIHRDWYTGVRLDWTKNSLDERQEVWGVSPYISWYWSEFLRWRVEYQHRAGDVPTENTLYFQATWIFGAHPPHPYWATR